ncbi:MAG: hypothetical protein V3V53_18680, partial [Bacteroidales bacterium]
MRYGIISFLLGITLTCNAQNSYFISPEGDNQDQGTINKPFATLQAALDEISAKRFSGDTSVIDVFF